MLLREVLHSFRQANYKGEEFIVKADLSKAFDRVRWDYLFYLLPLYGFPPKLIQWIYLCVTSAKFTIILNGKGDGFITLSRGLRQGCALSPYLFIIAMDPLSGLLQLETQQGRLTGVRVAPTAPRLTNSMFADDLLIMGNTGIIESNRIMKVVDYFCEVSGQKLNIDKSTIWFSNAVPNERRQWFLTTLGIKEAIDSAHQQNKHSQHEINESADVPLH